jgi:hypothetical protein
MAGPWPAANGIRVQSKAVTLLFAGDGHHGLRTGPDEARGHFPDDPRKRVTLQRLSNQGECAGYFP